MLFHKDSLSRNLLLRLFELVTFVVAVDLFGGARRVEAETFSVVCSATVVWIGNTTRLLRINVEAAQGNLLVRFDTALRIETIVVVSLAHVWK